MFKPGHRIVCKNTITLLFVLLFTFPAIRGQDKTQYLLHEIPQTISLNPAISYECKNYIQLPVISQLQASYRNNGFSYSQAFEGGRGITRDSVIIDVEGLSRAMVNRNHLRLGARTDILGFGFAYYDWYFSMSVSNRSAFRVSFNRDIIDARDGNWDLRTNLPREININGTGIHLLNYTEFAFGASYLLYPGLSIGVRPKYLVGSSHLQTRRSDIKLLTSESPIELTGIADILVRGSLPVTVEVDDEGIVTGIESNIDSFRDLPGFLFAWNHGFALDAGLIYEYSDKITLSASMLDLGFIHWRKNVNVISQQEDFVFQGIDLNNYIQTGTDTDFLQALEDSIASSFRLSGSEDPYVAMLPLRMFAGVDYQWNKQINLGAVAEGEIISGRFYPTLTITAISRPTEWFSASISYSLMDRGFSNLGFGLVMGSRLFQFYFITDNIPINYVRELESGILFPYSARTMNMRFGLNIIFGCKDDRDSRNRGTRWRKSCPAYN
ncbi:MAG: DUF5723 family protein [Bacteroidales bacterium]